MSSAQPNRKAGKPAINMGGSMYLISGVEVNHTTNKPTTIGKPPIRGMGVV
jgi:hypothetical protein